jgi:hypothetical protein
MALSPLPDEGDLDFWPPSSTTSTPSYSSLYSKLAHTPPGSQNDQPVCPNTRTPNEQHHAPSPEEDERGSTRPSARPDRRGRPRSKVREGFQAREEGEEEGPGEG